MRSDDGYVKAGSVRGGQSWLRDAVITCDVYGITVSLRERNKSKADLTVEN